MCERWRQKWKRQGQTVGGGNILLSEQWLMPSGLLRLPWDKPVWQVFRLGQEPGQLSAEMGFREEPDYQNDTISHPQAEEVAGEEGEGENGFSEPAELTVREPAGRRQRPAEPAPSRRPRLWQDTGRTG